MKISINLLKSEDIFKEINFQNFPIEEIVQKVPKRKSKKSRNTQSKKQYLSKGTWLSLEQFPVRVRESFLVDGETPGDRGFKVITVVHRVMKIPPSLSLSYSQMQRNSSYHWFRNRVIEGYNPLLLIVKNSYFNHKCLNNN